MLGEDGVRSETAMWTYLPQVRLSCDVVPLLSAFLATARLLVFCGLSIILSHLSVSSCLRSWLEQDTSCPTCRTSLSDLHSVQRAVHDDLQPVPAQQPVPNPRRHRARRTNRFHFDGNLLIFYM